MHIITSIILSLPLVGAYAIFAIGIVLIYRASKVLNLAHGAMAMIPAYLLYSMVQVGIPRFIALMLALAAGALLGLLVERVFVRRLRAVSATAQTVGTVAALGIMVALAARIWGTTPREAVTIFPEGFISVGSSGIKVGELGLFGVMIVVSVALFLLLSRTDLGLMMRGTAESRLAASLHGVDPDRTTQLTWAIGGALAGLAGILLAAVTNLNPYVLTLQALPGFIAALLGGLGSLIGAVVGAAVVGVTQGMVPVLGALGRTEGAPQLLLAVLALAVMASRGRAIVASSDFREAATGGGQSASNARPRIGTWLLLAGLYAIFPWVVPQSMIGSANLAAAYAMVAISIVLLTGWVGQISLGHAALVGIGAYMTGIVAGGLGIPFPVSIVPAAVVAGAVATALGVVALRVRGLYLAVATLVFSWMASEYLFRQPWFVANDQIPATIVGGDGTFPSFDFSGPRPFYFIGWALVTATAYAVMNIRDFKHGRAFFAVRGSEMAAASLGIDVTRTKLVAFAISGMLAGAAGNMLMSDALVISPDQFNFNISLFFLAVAVVGGLNSVSGAVASALLFAGLTEVFFRVEALGGLLEIVSALLLAVVLVAYPGGLAQVPTSLVRVTGRLGSRLKSTLVRTRLAETTQSRRDVVGKLTSSWRVARRRFSGLLGRLKPSPLAAESPVEFRQVRVALHETQQGESQSEQSVILSTNGSSAEPASNVADLRVQEQPSPHPDRTLRRPLIEAAGVTVRFGGLTAVKATSLSVREGEIVGLIGPNGAGKTTLFNAIAGFNSPSEGRIHLLGRDVTALPVHRRAMLGVARTFQAIQLFGSLTVFDNLLVATHVHNPTGLMSSVFASDAVVEEERKARDRVDHVLGLLGLTGIAQDRIGDLPFGLLRMVEVARAMVTGFPVMMLDEPASGLDNTETDRLIEVLRFVRTLGITQLLIEHDVRMVTSVSDYVYVLDQGQIIASGEPAAIQRDPAVIAAYLGEPSTGVSA